MLGVDTNVLIRHLIRDDQPQYKKARRLIDREGRKGDPPLVSLLVLLESEWVLRSRYELPKSEFLKMSLQSSMQPPTGLPCRGHVDGRALNFAGFVAV